MIKNVLITGAAKRIGAACARLLHERGCNIILHCHASTKQALQLCDELNAARSHSATLLKADLMVEAELNSLAEFTLNAWGGVDVLVNNASQFTPGGLGEITGWDWDTLLNSNLKAPFFLSQALAPSLTQRRGCIVNLVDIYAEKGLPGYPVFSIAKAGLIAMTKCLAKELAPNVRVNAVAPGAILWPEAGLDDARKNEILQRVALQRCGTTTDIAKAIAFLIFEADYITGHTLTVDGGRTLFI